MINRFKIASTHEGRTIHCVVVEPPRRANARVIVACQNGKAMRVPTAMLKHVPEGSPITEEQAEQLLDASRRLVAGNRAVDRQKRQQRARLNAELNALLGGVW